MDVITTFTYPTRVQQHRAHYFLTRWKKRLGSDGITDLSKEFLRELELLQQTYGVSVEILSAEATGIGFVLDERALLTLKKAAEFQIQNRLKSLISRQTLRSEAFQALNPPVRVIPKSLHPNQSSA